MPDVCHSDVLYIDVWKLLALLINWKYSYFGKKE